MRREVFFPLGHPFESDKNPVSNGCTELLFSDRSLTLCDRSFDVVSSPLLSCTSLDPTNGRNPRSRPNPKDHSLAPLVPLPYIYNNGNDLISLFATAMLCLMRTGERS